MKRYTYACDGGALAIRTESAKFFYNNGFGDGEHDVFVTDDIELETSALAFVDSFVVFEGKTVEVLNYDCGETAWMKVHALCTLDAGHWFVYSDDGTMYLIKAKYMEQQREA